MKPSQHEHLLILLFGLLAGCEKEAIKAEKPKPEASAAAKSESARVDAEEVTPASSAGAKKKEKTCAPGGCAPGKCG